MEIAEFRAAAIYLEDIVVGLLVRFLLFVAGAIASWFVARDALNYISIQMTVVLLLFLLFGVVLALWPTDWIRKQYLRLKRSLGPHVHSPRRNGS